MATDSKSKSGAVAALFRPVDIASLAAFRIVFGGLCLAMVGRYFAYGWIDDFYLRPHVFFPYPGLEWIRPWPGNGMYLHFAVVGVAAALLTLGLFTRLSAAVFCLGFTYAHLIDRTNYLNHYYLISLVALLLVVVPSGAAASLDVWLGRVQRRTSVPAWCVWLLRFQLGVVYFFAGFAKLDHDWLIAAQPMRMWLAAWADVPGLGPLLAIGITAHLFAIAGAVFDLSVPFFLLSRRARPFAYAAVVVFHLATAILFPSIGLFPWLMMGLTPIFFSPSWPRRLLGSTLEPRSSIGDLATPAVATRRVVIAALSFYAAVQIAVPLRYLAYPGDVLWTEQGFRFAWRVMLMEKYGHAEFTAIDRESGQRWRIAPSDELTPLQTYMVSTQPDMLLSFARWLGDRWRERGHPNIEIRADVQVSLNGRPHRALLDPDADLLAAGETVSRIVCRSDEDEADSRTAQCRGNLGAGFPTPSSERLSAVHRQIEPGKES